MAAKQLINGKVYDWSSIDIGIDECENIEVTSINYSDALEREAVYGKGGKVRGYGNGNQSGSCDITMLREDYNEFCKYIKNMILSYLRSRCLMPMKASRQQRIR